VSDLIVDIYYLTDQTGHWVALACDGHEIERYGPFSSLAEAKVAADQAAEVAEKMALVQASESSDSIGLDAFQRNGSVRLPG